MSKTATETEREEQLAAKGLFHFDVIATINNGPQERYELWFPEPPSEAQVIFAAMLHLNEPQRNNLCKFSFCQYHTGITGVLDWVEKKECKYYFGEGKLHGQE